MRQAVIRAWCRPPTGQAALSCPALSTVVVTTIDLILGMIVEKHTLTVDFVMLMIVWFE